MKKLFTLVALLSCFLGANAIEWVEDYKLDYSTKTGFPFYVMGYVPEWFDGVMTDFGAMYTYKAEADVADTDNVIGDVTTADGTVYKKIQLAEAGWHQYFIADGIPTEIGGSYTVKAMVKASEPVTINVNMGWGWNEGQQASASVNIPAEWTEVEWDYTEIGGASCNLVAQPGTATATIEWKYVIVGHMQKEQRPVQWQEWLTNDGQPRLIETTFDKVEGYMGNAETPWADPTVRWNDEEKNYLICAWGKEKGVNLNDDGGWDPFPATIEDEGNGNHYFICHGKVADTPGDASAWDNQFWIESPRAWKSGEQVKVHFRYKASAPVSSTDTQIHYQNPSNYLIWHAIGNIAFTTEWQDFDGTMTIADDMAGGWSIAFNLNSVVKDAVDFYFDDLSWQSMKLDEGLFVASSNSKTGIEYDYDNAPEFTYNEELAAYQATVGLEGRPDSWINEVMISTIRGNDASFKANTLKPTGTITGTDPDEWLNYTESSLAKIKLPAAGVWRISVDTENKQMLFEKIEGETNADPLPETPNTTEIVIHGVERDDLSDQVDQQTGEVTVREEEGGTGEAWDNQFFLVSNRELSTGEVTILKFKYKSSIPAHTTTQLHGAPGAYMHWAAIGDVDFTEEWQNFETTLTIPSEANGMKSIAFNMAEIKAACDYYITDVIWMTEDHMETLINTEGGKNFYIKVGAGTNPEPMEGDGISTVKANVANNAATYNLAGQKVGKDYKGLVIKSGKKMIQK